jgi:signal transduction histidine kinase
MLFVIFLAGFGYIKFISKNRYGLKLYKKINKAIKIQKEHEQSLIHKSVLTKLGELATFIIHDLRQPLQDIKLSAEEIKNGITGEDMDLNALNDLLKDIFQDVERISSMTDYVINSSNKKVYEKEIEFDINTSIGNAYRMIRKQLSRDNISLKMDLNENLPPVLGNPWKFEHGLLNIISNSCHALNDVRKFKKESFREEFYVETFWDGHNVCVRIRDNGIGVISSFKSLMFYPFASSKKPEEGSGLGLSIVYNVVRQMRGRLDFVSTPFVGTMITLIFPAASDQDNFQPKENTFLAEIKNISTR